MIRSDIISKARKATNDTDSTNPFHSDAQCHGILDDWAIKAGSELKVPRTTQSISFAQGDGAVPASAKALNTDILAITRVIMFPTANESAFEHFELFPKSEEEMDTLDPAWRSRTDEAQPRYYIVIGAITAAAAAFTGRSITVNRRCDKAYTMVVSHIEMPAASTDGTKSPEFSAAMHKSAEYFLSWHMMRPRNSREADGFRRDFEKEFRMAKTLSPFIQDGEAADIWGPTPSHEA